MRYLYVAILSFLSFSLESQETILSYDVDVIVQSDSRILVTEIIKVRSEGDQIKRGIFRTIPTVRPDRSGKNEPAPVEILSVKRGGRNEPYHLEKSRTNVTVYIGKESVLLKPGEYIYELQYLAENQIAYFGDYDELYWNVIGHDWSFPVEEYSVVVMCQPHPLAKNFAKL